MKRTYTAIGRITRVRQFAISMVLACLLAVAPAATARAQGDCAPGWDLDGELCYPPCPAGFNGVGPVCWKNCPEGYDDDGATCRRNAHIFGADNSNCPGYDKCGLTFARGCSTCPEGYSNDGCTCRRDVHIFGKDTTTRGVGNMKRWAYRDLFVRFVNLHRPGAAASAQPLTESEKVFLKQFFPDRLVDQVRVLEVPGMTLPFFVDAAGTTIGNDLILIKQGHRSNQLLKHEFVHVCQADRNGLDQFMRDYADQYVDGGYSYANIGLERQAFDFERRSGAASAFLGYCGSPVRHAQAATIRFGADRILRRHVVD